MAKRKKKIVRRKTKTLDEAFKIMASHDPMEGWKVGDRIRTKLPYPIFSIVDKKSAVHHPSHYGGADNPFETIKVLEARLTREEFIGAMKFQVYKYNDRALHKQNEIEDYEKGLFYQNRLVQRAKRKD